MFGAAPARVYTVHVPAKPGPGADRAVFVRDGFAWGAFVFSALWAGWHRMWFAALMTAAAVAAVAFAVDVVDLNRNAQPLVAAALGLYFGLEGNDWYRAALARRGYREAGIVVAPSLIDAEQRWFTRHLAAAPGTPT